MYIVVFDDASRDDVVSPRRPITAVTVIDNRRRRRRRTG